MLVFDFDAQYSAGDYLCLKMLVDLEKKSANMRVQPRHHNAKRCLCWACRSTLGTTMRSVVFAKHAGQTPPSPPWSVPSVITAMFRINVHEILCCHGMRLSMLDCFSPVRADSRLPRHEHRRSRALPARLGPAQAIRIVFTTGLHARHVHYPPFLRL